MRRETPFTKELTRQIVADGGIVIVMFANTFAHGWPDRLVIHRLWRGLIELKARDGELRDNQRKNLADVFRRDPAAAVVVREPDQVEDHEGHVLFRFSDGADLMIKLRQREVELKAASGY